MRIRDPIHGTLSIADCEVALVDSPFFQRLRRIRQLGFGEMAFPGATHTRHAHSLGATHVASRLFDSVFAHVSMPEPDRVRLRQAVRAAMLCHDLGHMPLSHSSERIAPQREALRLPAWVPGEPSARASHEDITARLVLDSDLTGILQRELGPVGVGPESLAALVLGCEPPRAAPFTVGGRDYGPLLRQIVSGELDADRMDYLMRDSVFTGVSYGRFDLDWILQNLLPIERDGRVHLGLAKAAIFAFEDFLLSRFHMFVSVYYHHTSVNFDEMLRRFYLEEPAAFSIPAEPGPFVGCDDVALAWALRGSSNRWARRIVARKGYKLIAQWTELDRDYDVPEMTRTLEEAGIDHFHCESLGVLSKYFTGADGGPSLYVVDPHAGTETPIADYTPLYQRYGGALRLARIYALPERADEARALVMRRVRERREGRASPLSGERE